jgi:hypothetical protein
VSNIGIGAGDYIYLRNNPLSDNARNVSIPALRDRGVRVFFEPFDFGVK